MRTSESGWIPDREPSGRKTPAYSREKFDLNQQGKPVKAIVGVCLLVVLALILSRMNPVPHEITADPSMTTGQAATEPVR